MTLGKPKAEFTIGFPLAEGDTWEFVIVTTKEDGDSEHGWLDSTAAARFPVDHFIDGTGAGKVLKWSRHCSTRRAFQFLHIDAAHGPAGEVDMHGGAPPSPWHDHSDTVACTLALAQDGSTRSTGVVLISCDCWFDASPRRLSGRLYKVSASGNEAVDRARLLQKWTAATSDSLVVALVMLESDVGLLMDALGEDERELVSLRSLEGGTFDTIALEKDCWPFLVSARSDQLAELAVALHIKPSLFEPEQDTANDQNRRRRGHFLLGSAIFLVLALLVTTQVRWNMLFGRHDTQARELASKAAIALERRDLSKAMILGVEALRRAESPEAQAVLRRSLELTGQAKFHFKAPGTSNSAYFSPDAAFLTTIHGSAPGYQSPGGVRHWNLRNGREECFLPVGGSDAAVRHDGLEVAAAGEKEVVLWDLRRCSARSRLSTKSRVLAIQYFPASGRLAIAHDNGEVASWDGKDGAKPVRLWADPNPDGDNGESDRIVALAFSPDGSYLLHRRSEDFTVRNIKDGTIVLNERILVGFAGFAFASQRPYFARAGVQRGSYLSVTNLLTHKSSTVDADGSVAQSGADFSYRSDGKYFLLNESMYDAASLEVVSRFPETYPGTTFGQFSNQGNLAAYRGADGVHLVTVQPEKRHWREILVLLTREQVTGLRFSDDDRLLATIGDSVTVWRIDHNDDFLEFPPAAGETADVAFTPNGLAVLGVDVRGNLYRLHRQTGERDTLGEGLSSEEFSESSPIIGSEGRYAVVRRAEGNILLSLEYGRRVLLPNGIDGATFDPEEHYLAFSVGSSVQLMVTETGEVLRTLQRSCGSLSLARGGRLLSGLCPQWQMWDLQTRSTIIRTVPCNVRQDYRGSQVAFDPSGQYLLFQCETQPEDAETAFTRVLRAGTGERVSDVPARSEGVVAPSGKYVAFRAEGVRIWDIEGARVVLDLATTASRMRWSRDGKSLVTWDAALAQVWEVESGKELFRIGGGDRGLAGVSLSADGRLLAYATQKGVRVIALRSADIIEDVCSRLPENLTEKEWQDHFPSEQYRRTCDKLP